MITSTKEISPCDVANHYNQLDQFYRIFWGEHVHHGLWEEENVSPDVATERLIDLVTGALDLKSDQQICDIGCGYGGTARYLTRKFDVNVTGLTLSEEQAAHADLLASRLEKAPIILVKNWLNNEFPDNHFDGVISIECLAHVTDKPRYFSELARVLKPGKRASITAWLSGDSVTKQKQKNLLEAICNEGRLPGMGTEHDYVTMIESAGLKVDYFEDLTRKVEKTWSICCRRTVKGIFTNPAVWKYILSSNRSEMIFLPSLWRIAKAYQCGAMRYGWYVIEKPV